MLSTAALLRAWTCFNHQVARLLVCSIAEIYCFSWLKYEVSTQIMLTQAYFVAISKAATYNFTSESMSLSLTSVGRYAQIHSTP